MIAYKMKLPNGATWVPRVAGNYPIFCGPVGGDTSCEGGPSIRAGEETNTCSVEDDVSQLAAPDWCIGAKLNGVTLGVG
ncbi:hypothetical protein D3C81_957840 [compost metagenome]